MYVFATLLLFISNFMHVELFLCKMLQQQKRVKGTRSARTNFGKEEVLKSAHDSCSDLNIIQGGREAHILLYSPWARGGGPRSLIKIETAIYIYIYIYIYGAVPDCMYVDLCLFWEANILGTQSCVVGMQS